MAWAGLASLHCTILFSPPVKKVRLPRVSRLSGNRGGRQTMSGVGEGLAEIGQGAMAAHAVEPEAGGHHHGGGDDGHTHETACLNCGTGLLGSHCHVCGQAAHVHRTLGAFFHDLLHGVFHFEGKIWRTLPLLALRPGKLTREYIDGRRASYISPIALFLFSIFLMFAVFHATEGTNEDESAAHVAVNVNLKESVETLEDQLSRLETERADALARGEATAQLDERIGQTRETIASVRELKADSDENLGLSDITVKSDVPQIDHALKKLKENPELVLYKLQTYAYKYSWVLIPLSVPFLWLLFPFSRRFHLYDHTVFVTYSLCFMTMLVIIGMLGSAVGLGALGVILLIVPPFHMFLQLRGAYGLSFVGALVRTVLLLYFSLIVLLVFFLIIMAQSGG